MVRNSQDGVVRVLDHFPHLNDDDALCEFDQMIELAELQAVNSKDMEFVADTRSKFDQYGDRMFFSNKQFAWLKRITGETDE